ncbi:MAG: hypothetical protein V7L22_06940 [Nostoc sp.]|uniref:hypothetical protein n=1 Tax=Nostoc sp. TaxID=1180 RepID=UPI002FFAA3A2
MKSSFITLVVVISALTLSQSAYGNEENILNTTSDRNQAEVLLTQPATINSTWNNFIGQANNPQQTAESVSLTRERGCPKISPLELINDPGSFFKQCQQPASTQSSQSTEPIEYLKVPKLDSGTGISVTVTQF